MDVFAQWPAELRTGSAPEGVKIASDDSLEGLVRRASMAAVEWESEKTAELVKEGNRVPVSKSNIWRHPDAHPLVLLSLTLDKYGQDSLEWEPETLRMTLEKDGLQLSQSVWTKILAARTLLLTPSPWRQWHVLAVVARGLAGLVPNFHYLEEPELGQLGAAIDMMKIADPTRETTDEIDKFVAAVFKSDGQPWAMPPLDFAQYELEEPELECKSCGSIHRNDGDVKCVTCGSQLLLPLPYPFAALRDQVKAVFAKKSRTLSDSGLDPEDPADLCVGRLLDAWAYIRERRSALSQQLRLFQ